MVGFLHDSKNLTGFLSAVSIVGIIACISTGQIKIPLPPPAVGKYVNAVPKGVLPWKPRPLEGAFAPNTRLLEAVRLFDGQIQGAESVAVRPNGDLALLDKFGNLFQAHSSGSSSSSGGSTSSTSSSNGQWQLQQQPVASLGAGRPLGYHFDAAGDLIICDSVKGLIKYDYLNRQVTVLANRVSSSSALDPGSEVTYANDLAIASDGKVYFTSCSDIVPSKNSQGFYDTFRAWSLDLAQGLPGGRLMVFDPMTQETIVLAKGLYYANGVALAADESYLLLAETDRIRVVKYWIKGPKAGIVEPLLENLPGVPDGVSTAPDGHFWVGLVNRVPPIAALLKEPVVRALYAWLPTWARPPVRIWGAVAKISGEDGAVADFLMDPSGHHVFSVSAAVEHDGRLFLGNLAGNYISYFQLSATAAAAAAAPVASAEAPAGAAATADAAAANAADGVLADRQLRAGEGRTGLPDVGGDPDHENDNDNDNDNESDSDNGNDRECHNEEPAAVGVTQQQVGSCRTPPGTPGAGSSPEAQAALFVSNKLANNKVVVFSKSYCPFCRKAKEALGQLLHPDDITVVELDEMPDEDASAIQAVMQELTGAATVPRVFVAGHFVGGGDDTAAKAASGELGWLLKEQGLKLKSACGKR